MSELYNFPLTSSDKEEKDTEIIPKNDSKNLHKIRHIVHKNKRARSQSAPLEEANNDDDAEFLSSYNYYIFYHSKNPRDPHLPKPTYVPNPDLGDIKESKAKDEEDQPKINNDKHLDTITQMMNNLNLDKPMDFNKLLNDEFQNDNTNINNNKLNSNLNINNNNNIGNNLNNMQNNDNMNLLQNKLDIFGDDNFNMYNFVNNDNICNDIPNNKLSKKSDNNINNLGNYTPFNPNVNNNINEFDIYNSNKYFNNNINLNNNINSNLNNNNNLLNMILF